jgi:hypothetical protein
MMMGNIKVIRRDSSILTVADTAESSKFIGLAFEDRSSTPDTSNLRSESRHSIKKEGKFSIYCNIKDEKLKLLVLTVI